MNDLARYRLLTGASIPPAAKLLYSYLLDRAGGRNGALLLSSRRLASEVGLSTSAVRRNLHRLQQNGLIRLTPRYSEEGIRLTNQITFV
ncbi:helix-turn-helix domain-containing protein [Paenibacillus sp. MZ04-78.2]|uniref:helix-turn-helix domain-containing protein n=1 Tax=Paenibacillus sp. MZ04-78.2 TaxID=2962034 RepID=UPI0020B7E706|nr:helix-turn-helix domain-containing protein [Paenibacillus sp. MZ04-78.2]MCP3774612.1 helix-turn-helix domain-containing protein [Paenibacillus sp. MZ04-78.2]